MIEILQRRLAGFKQILEEDTTYPIQLVVLDFPIIQVESEFDLKGRIKELQEIIWFMGG